jgi:hypothetical protein
MSNMKHTQGQEVRQSAYKDYIALDFTEGGKIISTPFYIREGEQAEVHWPRPSNEQCKNPAHYDDYHDTYLFKMEGGELFVQWTNGPCSHMEIWDKLNPSELVDWKFQYANRIKAAIKKATQ